MGVLAMLTPVDASDLCRKGARVQMAEASCGPKL